MDYRNYRLDKSIGHKITQATRLMTNRLNQNFKASGLPVTNEQWSIMIRLWERDGLYQHELASSTQRDEASVSRLINNMMKRNLVVRRPHPTDKRANLIYLTEEGREMQKALIEQALLTIEQTTEGIDEKDLETFMRVADQIITNLKGDK
ncbi:MarR family winged helix-turn-helix transcriptional regulator [Paenibacillus turpanensis]|uniref:MarR family winged helix-turn-helix transcriptional regulator n=1 Tax=Paenibacillus turpanensis TaxID=2689078 RepID=UPI00140A0D4C|nr:MarR family transcriptional regulator [Paenibacillus turpanensis]